MSTLTKILIVLLSLCSIFLCGAVVTYMGNTTNYSASLKEQKSLTNSLKASNASLQQHYNEKVTQMKELEKKLNENIVLLEDKNNEVMVQLRASKRMNLEYQGRVNSWAGVLTSFEQTIGNLEQSLKLTQEQLDKTRGEGVKDRKYLKEIEAKLYETVVQMQSLEAERKRLLEQNTSLEKQLTQLLGSEVTAAAGETVTQTKGLVRPAGVVRAAGDIKGLITEVGQSLVTVSVGSADGVQKGMVFHATRGDDFICDVIITDVDTNKSAGILDLVQRKPIIGDNVSIRL